jgi:hypothetical protein
MSNWSHWAGVGNNRTRPQQHNHSLFGTAMYHDEQKSGALNGILFWQYLRMRSGSNQVSTLGTDQIMAPGHKHLAVR